MNFSPLLRLAPLIDPIMNKLSHRYRMHNELVNALENVLLVIEDSGIEPQPFRPLQEVDGQGISLTWKVRELENAQDVLAKAQGFKS